jgi:hypothetical protein
MINRPHPIAGEDYPRTYQEFLEWFSDESACRRYIVRCRWPNGFECTQCGIKLNLGLQLAVIFIVGSVDAKFR